MRRAACYEVVDVFHTASGCDVIICNGLDRVISANIVRQLQRECFANTAVPREVPYVRHNQTAQS